MTSPSIHSPTTSILVSTPKYARGAMKTAKVQTPSSSNAPSSPWTVTKTFGAITTTANANTSATTSFQYQMSRRAVEQEQKGKQRRWLETCKLTSTASGFSSEQRRYALSSLVVEARRFQSGVMGPRAVEAAPGDGIELTATKRSYVMSKPILRILLGDFHRLLPPPLDLPASPTSIAPSGSSTTPNFTSALATSQSENLVLMKRQERSRTKYVNTMNELSALNIWATPKPKKG